MKTIRITYQESSGSEGVTLTPGMYSRHPLNTLHGPQAIDGFTLFSDGAFALPAGNFLLFASCSKPYGVPARLALRKASDMSIVAEGCTNGPAGAGGGPGAGVMTPLYFAEDNNVLDLALFADTGSFALGPDVSTGLPLSTGTPEVYAEVVILQLPGSI